MKHFAVSIQGADHINVSHKPCQDASAVFDEADYTLVVVSDGHGGDEYFRSETGADFAVEAAHETIDAFIKATKEKQGGFFNKGANHHKDNLKKIAQNIVSAWQGKVLNHIKAYEWTAEEKDDCAKKNVKLPAQGDKAQVFRVYGATLAAVVIAKTFWFALHVGDGRCVVIKKSGVFPAVEEDDTQGFGSTHSLCNSDVLAHFRMAYGFEGLVGATAATDGVTDSLTRTDYLYGFTVNVLKGFADNEQEAKDSVISTLSKLTNEGSGDDVSLACAFDTDYAGAEDILKIVIDAKNRLEGIKESKDNQEAYSLKTEVAALMSENQKLTADLARAKQEKEGLEKETARLNATIAVQKKELDEEKKQNNRFRETIRNLENTKKTLLKHNSALNAKLVNKTPEDEKRHETQDMLNKGVAKLAISSNIDITA